MRPWTTEFSVVARHSAEWMNSPLITHALCTLACAPGRAIVHCECPSGAEAALLLEGDAVAPLVMFHDLIVPRLKLVPLPVRIDDDAGFPSLTERMRMFNLE